MLRNRYNDFWVRAQFRVVDIGLGIIADMVIVIATYLAALLLLALGDGDYAKLGGGLTFIVYMVAAALVLPTLLFAFGVYKRIWSRTSGYGVTILINAVAVATLLYIGILFILPSSARPFQLIILGNVFALVGFVAVRYRSRLVNSFGWFGSTRFRKNMLNVPLRVLIIGAGEAGQTLAWRLKHRYTHTDTRYEIVGFIDDDIQKQGMFVEGCRILGTRYDILNVADVYKVDLIVVAVHRISAIEFREILTYCEQTKAMIKVVPDLQELVNSKFAPDFLRDVQPEDLIGRTAITQHEGIDLSPVTQKTVLVTGSAGSIGSELSDQIMKYVPDRVILLDNNESGLYDLTQVLKSKHPAVLMVAVLADVTRRDTIRAVFEEFHPQIVFHAAAYKHVPLLQFYPHEALYVNVRGTRNVAELAQEFDVERFVLVSTDKAVKPSNVMGASKRVCELMLHALSQNPNSTTRYAAVRFGNVLGSRGSVVPTFSRQIDAGGPVTVTDKEMTRYFMSIPEAVNLIIHAACMTNGDDIYVLQMGEVVRIVELAERMIRLRGLRPYMDIQIQFTGIRPGEKMHEELFSQLENPCPTEHPSILKAETWDVDFQSDAFWEKIDGLLEMSIADGDVTLERIRAIISPNLAAAINGQHDAVKAS